MSIMHDATLLGVTWRDWWSLDSTEPWSDGPMEGHSASHWSSFSAPSVAVLGPLPDARALERGGYS